MKTLRVLLGVFAVVLIMIGAALALVLGPDSTWGGELKEVPEGQKVVTTAPDLFNVTGFQLRVTAQAGDGEVFLGAGHQVHVEDYVKDVKRTRITVLAADGIGSSAAAEGTRTYPAAAPADLDFWQEKASGPGEQHVEVDITDEAPVQVAVMPMSAQGVAPMVGVGYSLPGAFIGGVVAAVIGLLLLVGVIVWGRRSRRTTRAAVVADGPTAASQPSSSGALTRGSHVVALGMVGCLALVGCSIPGPADYGDDSGVVPLTTKQAQPMLDGYDTRNDAAIKKSNQGDGSGWPRADAGPLLAADLVAAKQAKFKKAKKPGKGSKHTAGEVYETRQSAYPLWSVMEVKTEASKKGDDPVLYSYSKDRAAGQWKAFSGVKLTQDVPQPLPAREATPSKADLKRAAAVDADLEKWIESGKSTDLAVNSALTKARTGFSKTSKGIDRIEQSAEPWGGVDDRTAPGGSVRVVRVKGGLLLMTHQEWDISAYLVTNYIWRYSDRDKEVLGLRDNRNAAVLKRALTSAILVPDSGKPKVIGSSLQEVSDFPR